MNNKIKLSGRELDVMNVLWESDKALVTREIAGIDPSLSINTVRMVLKGLLNKGYIKVSEIVHSGTVLTQSYAPILSAQDYMINQMTKAVKGHISQEQMVVSLLQREKNELETIEKLEELLRKRKEDLEKDD